MSYCESIWDYIPSMNYRVCRECGWIVTGDDLRTKGQQKAVEAAARSCALSRAIKAQDESLRSK